MTDLAGWRPGIHNRERFFASPSDIEAVRAFAHTNGLEVSRRNIGTRVVRLMGPAEAVNRAFGIELYHYGSSDNVVPSQITFRGNPLLPYYLGNSVVDLHGLYIPPPPQLLSNGGAITVISPQQAASQYQFPANYDGTALDGSGECIGILALAGGYQASDLSGFFSPANPPTVISQGPMAYVPLSKADPTIPEISSLDITGGLEIAGAVAPGALFAVYVADSIDPAGLAEVLGEATTDTVNKPTVLMIQFGWPESHWGTQGAQGVQGIESLLQDAAEAGIAVLASSGNTGTACNQTDGSVNVNYPSSSAFVLSCGGTQFNFTNTTITGEVLWADAIGASGGGVSTFFAVPAWQSAAQDAGIATFPVNLITGAAGRAVPDVSGNASDTSQYGLYVGGKNQNLSGTSFAVPLYAGLVALISQAIGILAQKFPDVKSGTGAGGGTDTPWLNNMIYSIGQASFTDITQPAGTSNGFQITNAKVGSPGYPVGPGWDACTGFGSILGTTFMNNVLALMKFAFSL